MNEWMSLKGNAQLEYHQMWKCKKKQTVIE